jgi:hypothetical protein
MLLQAQCLDKKFLFKIINANSILILPVTESKVYCKIPRAGLGNMLLVWAKGFVFAKKYELEFSHSGFLSLQPGAWIRREKSSRLYWNYFVEKKIRRWVRFKVYGLKLKKVVNPSFDISLSPSCLYIFTKHYDSNDFFKELKPFKREISNEIYRLLNPKFKRRLEEVEPPIIGAHIRRGDFKYGSSLTPLSFFIDAINIIRKSTGVVLPVTIFSDGTDKELKDVLSLPAVSRSTEKDDIIDLLLLSRSRFLILSVNSTFSYWAAFLSRAGHIIKSKDEWHSPLRAEDDNLCAFEGHIDANKPLPNKLKQYLELYR